MVETIIGKDITISIKGKNEKDINAAMSKAFAQVQKQLNAGQDYGSKLIGKNKVSWEVAEHIKPIRREKSTPRPEEAPAVHVDPFVYSVEVFMAWMKEGLTLPDMKPVFEHLIDTDTPATIKTELTDEIETLCGVLVKLQHLNRCALEKQLKRAKVVSIREWGKLRSA